MDNHGWLTIVCRNTQLQNVALGNTVALLEPLRTLSAQATLAGGPCQQEAMAMRVQGLLGCLHCASLGDGVLR